MVNWRFWITVLDYYCTIYSCNHRLLLRANALLTPRTGALNLLLMSMSLSRCPIAHVCERSHQYQLMFHSAIVWCGQPTGKLASLLLEQKGPTQFGMVRWPANEYPVLRCQPVASRLLCFQGNVPGQSRDHGPRSICAILTNSLSYPDVIRKTSYLLEMRNVLF